MQQQPAVGFFQTVAGVAQIEEELAVFADLASGIGTQKSLESRP
jgi:hypothetical protein